MAFTSSRTLNDIMYLLQSYEVTEVILPFLLIFTILFAILQRVQIFGEDKKNISVILSLIMSTLAVVPHMTNRYPSNYDPIVIINTLIPSAAVIAVVIILVLFLFGMFGSKFMEGGIRAWVAILILGILFYIFGTTVGWWEDPSRTFGDWWDSDFSTLIIVIAVFGIIIGFITSEEKKSTLGKLWEGLGKKLE